MDNITHGAIGIVTGWLRRVGPSRDDTDRAVPWATFFAAEAPDFDVFLRRIPGLEGLGHRGLTHTFVALPFTALLVALVCKLFFRRARLSVLFGWAAAGMLVGHLIADIITWTGIRPFLPWSNLRVNYEVMPFIDPAVTITLVGVVMCGVTKPEWRQRAALAATAMALLYFTGRGAAYYTAKSMWPSASAVPTGQRVVMVDPAGGFIVKDVRLWSPWRVVEQRLPRASDDPLVRRAAWGLVPQSRYLRPRMPHFLVQERGDTLRVVVADLLPHFPLGYPWAEVDANGTVIRTGRTWTLKGIVG